VSRTLVTCLACALSPVLKMTRNVKILLQQSALILVADPELKHALLAPEQAVALPDVKNANLPNLVGINVQLSGARAKLVCANAMATFVTELTENGRSKRKVARQSVATLSSVIPSQVSRRPANAKLPPLNGQSVLSHMGRATLVCATAMVKFATELKENTPSKTLKEL
jgi:hypothetical protein